MIARKSPTSPVFVSFGVEYLPSFKLLYGKLTSCLILSDNSLVQLILACNIGQANTFLVLVQVF